MSKQKVILPSIIIQNIEQVKYILEHPEDYGSGTKKDWEKRLKELESLLENEDIILTDWTLKDCMKCGHYPMCIYKQIYRYLHIG